MRARDFARGRARPVRAARFALLLGVAVAATALAGTASGTAFAEPAAAQTRPATRPAEDPPLAIREDLSRRLAQFAPTRIEADLSGLRDSERQVLDKIIEASRLMGEIFQRQAWAANPGLREKVAASRDPRRKDALRYFDLHVGPWDRVDSEPFIGEAARPPGAGYYPPDMTKEEFDAWLKAHPEDQESFRGLFTLIRRSGDGLGAVPYSEAYRAWLEPAARLLREAAEITENASLKAFLLKRADAFLSDDYYDSDVAWMDLDSRIEVTIGPYETYEDRLFGYKAAYESFVTVQDPDASARLDAFKKRLPEMERNLPIPDEHKNLTRGGESPIRVVDVAFAAGDTRAGVQTIAFNLPNDERVRETKGSKKVLLRNVMNAKYESILKPIAGKVIAPEQLRRVTADAFFNEILFHELSHGLGPGIITVNGRKTEARLELKEIYSALEEAKADAMGVYSILYMIEQGGFPRSMRDDLFVTYLAGMFRSVRFGIEEAHGRGVALQYNYLRERGAILRNDASGRFSVDFAKFEKALEDLVRDLCMVQARGDYDAGLRLLGRYAKVPPEWQAALDRLSDIPVDIRPIYPAAGEED
jgi:hypothetical protein